MGWVGVEMTGLKSSPRRRRRNADTEVLKAWQLTAMLAGDKNNLSVLSERHNSMSLTAK
jgi:hypothetical protein